MIIMIIYNYLKQQQQKNSDNKTLQFVQIALWKLIKLNRQHNYQILESVPCILN